MKLTLMILFFFFSSRRRHTRCSRDWSSDVCSSDLIFAAGTGNPYFSTDTAAALRAMEIKAEAILKATRVEGVYDADPEQVPDARFFAAISYREVLSQNLKVMDATAISLCMDNGMPIVVFNMNRPGNIKRVVLGERVGSKVTPA